MYFVHPRSYTISQHTPYDNIRFSKWLQLEYQPTSIRYIVKMPCHTCCFSNILTALVICYGSGMTLGTNNAYCQMMLHISNDNNARYVCATHHFSLACYYRFVASCKSSVLGFRWHLGFPLTDPRMLEWGLDRRMPELRSSVQAISWVPSGPSVPWMLRSHR